MEAKCKRGAALLIALAMAAALFWGLARANLNSRAILAVDGAADASALGGPEGPYMLSGAWRRYGGSIEDPSALQGRAYTLTEDLRFFRNLGEETFLVELRGAEGLELSLDTGGLRLWINGERAAYSVNERIVLKDYDRGDGSYEIIISNTKARFYVTRCFVPLLGSAGQLIALKSRLAVCYVAVAALLALMLVQSLALYVRKPSERYLLWLICRIAVSFVYTANYGRFAGLYLPLIRYPLVIFVNAVGVLFPYAIIRNFTGNTGIKAPDICAAGSLVLLLISLLFFRRCFRILCDLVNIFMLLLQIGILAKGYLLWDPGGKGRLWLLLGAAVPLCYESFTLFINLGLLPHGYLDVQWQPLYLFSWMFYYIVMDAYISLYFAEKFAERDALYKTLAQKVEEQTGELRAANAQLLRSREETKNFMMGMIHNMQNPLFALGGYMDLLEDELPAPSPAQAKYLGLAENKLGQINKMVDDMFLVSRLDGEGIDLRLSNFNVEEMLQSLAQEARLSEKQPAVTVECSPPGLVVTADPMRLRQVMENLISNALRHSRPGGPIALSAQAGPEYVSLTVEDRGEGIGAALLPHIFERYVKGKNGSTGLGLYIVKSIVEQHGGSIRCESRKDMGASFIISLPREERSQEHVPDTGCGGRQGEL